MPRKYTRRRYRRYPRKGNYSGGKAAYALNVALKALAAAKMLKGLVNSEKKSYIQHVVGSSSSSGGVTQLSVISQGDTYGTRDGASVLAKGMTVKGSITHNQNNLADRCRLVYVHDKQQESGAAPSAGDILHSIGTYGVDAPIEILANPGRFNILSDKIYNFTSNSTSDVRTINEYIKFPGNGLKMKWSSSTGGSQVKNGVYLLNLTDATSSPPQLDLMHRTFFYDN